MWNLKVMKYGMTIKGSVEGKPEGGGEGDRHGYN
jgi:hypothetical protein